MRGKIFWNCYGAQRARGVRTPGTGEEAEHSVLQVLQALLVSGAPAKNQPQDEREEQDHRTDCGAFPAPHFGMNGVGECSCLGDHFGTSDTIPAL
jgi:hypothetical protein